MAEDTANDITAHGYPGSDTLTIFCPQCRDFIEVRDVRAYILAMHLSATCGQTLGWLHSE